MESRGKRNAYVWQFSKHTEARDMSMIRQLDKLCYWKLLVEESGLLSSENPDTEKRYCFLNSKLHTLGLNFDDIAQYMTTHIPVHPEIIPILKKYCWRYDGIDMILAQDFVAKDTLVRLINYMITKGDTYEAHCLLAVDGLQGSRLGSFSVDDVVHYVENLQYGSTLGWYLTGDEGKRQHVHAVRQIYKKYKGTDAVYRIMCHIFNSLTDLCLLWYHSWDPMDHFDEMLTEYMSQVYLDVVIELAKKVKQKYTPFCHIIPRNEINCKEQQMARSKVVMKNEMKHYLSLLENLEALWRKKVEENKDDSNNLVTVHTLKLRLLNSMGLSIGITFDDISKLTTTHMTVHPDIKTELYKYCSKYDGADIILAQEFIEKETLKKLIQYMYGIGFENKVNHLLAVDGLNGIGKGRYVDNLRYGPSLGMYLTTEGKRQHVHAVRQVYQLLDEHKHAKQIVHHVVCKSLSKMMHVDFSLDEPLDTASLYEKCEKEYTSNLTEQFHQSKFAESLKLKFRPRKVLL